MFVDSGFCHILRNPTNKDCETCGEGEEDVGGGIKESDP